MKYKLAIKKARVNIKSLAAESVIIRGEIRKTNDSYVINSLHYHRVNKVRPEARLANLAMAFLKGNKRSSAEITSKEIDIKKLHNKISGFAWPSVIVSLQEVQDWLKT